MLPVNESWPPEIDAMEADGASPTRISMTDHYGSDLQDQTILDGSDFTAGWHTFGVDWEPSAVTWYVDGQAVKTVSNPAEIPSQRMYPIVDLAINGQSPPNSSTSFPAVMRVSYVKVWQH
jgi:beta-glucanase (GH16 family)